MKQMNAQNFVEEIIWNSLESDNRMIREAAFKKLARQYRQTIEKSWRKLQK